MVITGRGCICLDCGKKDSVDEAVLHSVRSYKLLFPEEKVTTRRIQEWCGFIVGRKTIIRILDRHFKKIRLQGGLILCSVPKIGRH